MDHAGCDGDGQSSSKDCEDKKSAVKRGNGALLSGSGPGVAGSFILAGTGLHARILLVSVILASWLGMQAVHEYGHVLGAWLTGGAWLGWCCTRSRFHGPTWRSVRRQLPVRLVRKEARRYQAAGRNGLVKGAQAWQSAEAGGRLCPLSRELDARS